MTMADRPHPQPGKLKYQRPVGPFPKLDHVPGRRWQRLGQLTHLPNHFVRSLTHWLVGPYGRVGGHLQQVALVVCFQGIEEVPVASELRIRRQPVKMHATPGQQCRGDLRLRLERDLGRNTRLLATRGVGGPLLRQVQLVVQQNAARRSRPKEKHAYLAVLLLPEASAPLALHAHALCSTLDEARPVDHAHRAERRSGCRAHELFVKHRLDFPLHVLSLPGRGREEALPGQRDRLLDLRLVRRSAAEHQSHRLDALAPGAQQQAPQIPQGMLPGLPSPEAVGKTTVQVHQPYRCCAQFDRIHDKVLLKTSMKRRTGQLDFTTHPL